jgi:ribosomal protein S18 acetylase RimI-like enzyme
MGVPCDGSFGRGIIARTMAAILDRSPYIAMSQLLDNVMWHALSGPHAAFAVGTAEARRYAPGFSPIAGFVDAARPDFAALAAYCAPGERFYCSGWSGAAPAGWRVDLEATIVKMVWQGGLPTDDEAPEAIRLAARHVAAALALAELTHPGPFAPRTIELGDYFGRFDGDRLVAMAGERMRAGDLCEISGVCTHPEAQGRGLARRLMLKLIRRELRRGETPFLHVMHDNHGARRLYQRMGFRDHQEAVVRVVALC